MNPTLAKVIAVIGLRLIALYFVFLIIGNFAFIISAYRASLDSNAQFFLALYFFVIGFFLLVLILMWVFAIKIANMMLPSLHENKDEPVALQPNELWQMTFCAVGLFIFIDNIPQFIGLTIQYSSAFVKDTNAPVFPSQFFAIWGSSLFKVVVSLLLILRANFFVSLIKKFRQW